jgi:hypothetical protein
LNDGSRLDFAPSLQVGFDFKPAFADGTITQLLFAQDCDMGRAKLDKLRIVPASSARASSGACSCRFHLPFNYHRKRKRECRALTGLRLDPDPAAVHFDDAFRYGEA